MGSVRLHNTECKPEKLAAEGRTQGANSDGDRHTAREEGRHVLLLHHC